MFPPLLDGRRLLYLHLHAVTIVSHAGKRPNGMLRQTQDSGLEQSQLVLKYRSPVSNQAEFAGDVEGQRRVLRTGFYRGLLSSIGCFSRANTRYSSLLWPCDLFYVAQCRFAGSEEDFTK